MRCSLPIRWQVLKRKKEIKIQAFDGRSRLVVPVEARWAPDGVAHPRHVPASARRPPRLHHRRPRLPPRGDSPLPAPALPSSSISISNSSAGSVSSTQAPSVPVRPPRRGCRPAPPRRGAHPPTPAVTVSVLPSASTGREAAGQELPSSGAEAEY